MDVRVIFSVLDEITPGADLRAHIAELGEDGGKKMGVTQKREITAGPVAIGASGIALNLWECGAENEESPHQDDHAQHNVGREHAKGFVIKKCVVCTLRLHARNVAGVWFLSREDENCADENPGDGAEWIEGLREVESSD